MQKKYILFLIIFLVLVNSCQKETSESKQWDENILARVGDKTISKAEFIRRAEYTPRPKYCQQDFPIHKKIILNSLIAEKLLALEGQDTTAIFSNKSFTSYLKGRKEQAMRQYLQYKMGHERVEKIDTTKALKLAQFSKRKYKVDYITATNADTAQKIVNALKQNQEFSDVVNNYYILDSIPKKSVKWHEVEDDRVMEAFFTKNHDKNDIIGPIPVSNNQYLIAKIDQYEENVGENRQEFLNRFKRVVDYETRQAADEEYTEYVRQVMDGKKLNWNRDILIELVNIVAPQYLNSREEQKNRLQNIFWKIEKREHDIQTDREKLNNIRNQELFNVGGDSWTVERFLQYRRVHPLVFRKRKMKNHEFTENFQMAIVDMITDYYLTKEAYKQNLDEVSIVSRNYNMWKDHLAGMYMFGNYQKKLQVDSTDKSQEKIINKYYNPYIDSLQKKYSSMIEINADVFNDIEITKMQMIANKTNAPFPILVPPFPVLTNDHKMDYGSLMQ
ncbi:MAG: hypothetical protein K9N00_06685 [Candidatus Marinimicrobia bacterium]|nr:hypothetical protein [Candidatus Neomarinimicrobiota bacterium]